MISAYILCIVIGSIGFLYCYHRARRRKHFDFLYEHARVNNNNKNVHSKQQAVDLKSLTGRNFFDRLLGQWEHLQGMLGAFGPLKLIVFWLLLGAVADFFNDNFLQANFWLVVVLFLLLGSFVGYSWLNSRQHKIFEETFPVALNMLTSAVSSGESLTQAIAYVGSTLDGQVAEQFRLMGKRLQLGESPEDVFRKACVHLPYPTFYFFVITLRANMERGGQLKDIIQRLNKLMFNIRATDKKKYALTSEARISAKIVGAIPFIFLIIMRFTTPENYDFVMSDPSGRVILYYMLASEFVGIAIVWGLMRSVR